MGGKFLNNGVILGLRALTRPATLLLKHSDKKEHRYRDLKEELAKDFNLTPEEIKEQLPSGKGEYFDNRVGWASTYLKRAGLLDSPKRSFSVIAQKGLDVLKQKPMEINIAFLKQFTEFVEFQNSKREILEEPDSFWEIK